MGKIYRVGVFFDGTGNNKFIEGNRRAGGATNIAKLSELYEQFKGEKRGDYKLHTDRVYIEGIGTHTEEKEGKRVKDRHAWDEKIEKGAGGGGGERINEAITKVTALLKSHPYGKSDPDKFCERIIDVFGFSRGAAQARDFINTFYTDVYPDVDMVNFGFVGLYDTVGSFGKAGDNINMKPLDPSKYNEADGFSFANHEQTIDSSTKEILGYFEDYRDAVAFPKKEQARLGDEWRVDIVAMTSNGLKHAGYGDNYKVLAAELAFEKYNFDLTNSSAQRIFHIVSNDEVRKNFPLSSLLNIGGKHQEAAFPGVHADVGGGYDDAVTEAHSYSLGAYLGEDRAKEAAVAEKAKLSEDWKVNTYLITDYHASDFSSESIYGIKCTLQRKVTNSISRVTLHHMYNEAVKVNVPFKAMPTDEAHTVSAEMLDYYNLYSQNKRIFVKSDSQEVKKFSELTQSVNWEEIDNYRHHSSVDPKEASTHYDGDRSPVHILTKDSPDMIGGNDARYVNGKVEREIYKNKQGNAIVPKTG